MTKYLEDASKLSENETKYDLFSVIIHGGSAYGGHYHAYIKDILNEGNHDLNKDEKKENTSACNWYDFNDIYVMPVDEKTVLSQTGGENESESACMNSTMIVTLF